MARQSFNLSEFSNNFGLLIAFSSIAPTLSFRCLCSRCLLLQGLMDFRAEELNIPPMQRPTRGDEGHRG
jgi:hypothetical protein